MARRSTTRDRLVRTATELFSRQGYGQTGVNEIMQQARATSGSFYHFFPAKEDLVLAVLDHATETLETDIFATASEAAEEPVEQIFEILGAFRKYLVTNGFTYGPAVGCLAAELSETHPQVRAKASAVFDLMTGRIRSLLEKAAGSLIPDADPHELAELVVCALEGALVLARVSRSTAPLDATIGGLRRYLELLRPTSATTEDAPVSPRLVPQPPLQRADWRSW